MRHPPTVLALLTLLAFLMLPADRSHADDARPSLRIAVVDTGRISNESAEARAFNERMQQEVAQAREELAREVRRLQEMDQQAQNLNRESRQYRELRREVVLGQNRLQSMDTVLNQEFSERRDRARLDFFRHVQRAVAEVAREREVDLVLRKGVVDVPEDEAEGGVNPGLLMALDAQAVLYASAEFDITSQVVQKLNDEFNRRNERQQDDAPARN